MHIYLRHALFLIVFVSACGNPYYEKGDENKLIFKYNEAGGITSLDPAYASSFENISVVNQLYNGLVTLNKQLEIIPDCATNWDISDSGKTYTFYLRNDVYFNENKCFKNGKRKLKASDFKFSINRIADKSVGSPGFWITRYFATDSSGLPAIDCLNDTTLIIHLKSAFAPFLQVLTLPYCKITAPEAISFYGKYFRKNPVGTGPFYAKYWKENEILVLLKNQHYFEFDQDGNKLPYLDAINIFFIKDRYTEFLEFKAGNLHMLPGIEGSYKDEILDKNGKLKAQFSNQFIMHNAPFLKIDYLGFMLSNKDLPTVYQNKKIRMALNLAVDREAIIKYLRNNIGKSAKNGFLPEGLPSYSNNNNAYTYDMVAAQKMLLEEGYNVKDKKLPPLTLSVTPGYSDIAEFLQSEWKKIGLDLKIEILPSNIHAQKSAKGELMFFRKSWIGDYPDAENFLNLFSSENFCPKGPNYTHFNNQLFEKILSDSKLLTNNELRFEKYRQAEFILLEESPVIPLYYDRAVKFCKKNIQGIEMNALNQIELKKVYIK